MVKRQGMPSCAIACAKTGHAQPFKLACVREERLELPRTACHGAHLGPGNAAPAFRLARRRFGEAGPGPGQKPVKTCLLGIAAYRCRRQSRCHGASLSECK